MNLEKEIFNSRVSNYLDIIKEKVIRMLLDNADNPDMTIKFANGDYFLEAQKEYVSEYQQGLYDKQCMRVV